MGIYSAREAANRGWEELTTLEKAELEVRYLEKVVPEYIVDYLDLSDDALERLHTCLENVLHTSEKAYPNKPEQEALASLGRVVLSMWRDENSEDIQQAYLHREIEL